MLKERKELVEKEIYLLRGICAQDYLKMIRGEPLPQQYDIKRERLVQLEVDLSLINKMLAEGQV